MWPCAWQVGKKDCLSLFQVEHTGHSYTNTADLLFLHAGRSDDLVDQIGKPLHNGLIPVTRLGGVAGLVKHGSILHIHNRGTQIGAAHVTPDVFFHHSPVYETGAHCYVPRSATRT